MLLPMIACFVEPLDIHSMKHYLGLSQASEQLWPLNVVCSRDALRSEPGPHWPLSSLVESKVVLGPALLFNIEGSGSLGIVLW
jgi:hypothetical protein